MVIIRFGKKQCKKEINEHLMVQYSDPNIPQFICGDFNIDRNDPVNYELMLHTLGAHNGEISGDVKLPTTKLTIFWFGRLRAKRN